MAGRGSVAPGQTIVLSPLLVRGPSRLEGVGTGELPSVRMGRSHAAKYEFGTF